MRRLEEARRRGQAAARIVRVPSHLSHLKRWHGYPVPIVNCWGEEADDSRWYMDVDRNLPADSVSRYGIFSQGEPGTGDAFLAKQNPQRQRRIMVRGLCQVCGDELKSKRYIALSAKSTMQSIDVGDGPVVGLAEPPLCLRCVRFAVDVCPGLIRRRRDEDLVIARLHEWTLVSAHGYYEGPEQEAQIAANCVLWVKLIPTYATELETGKKIRFVYGGDADE